MRVVLPVDCFLWEINPFKELPGGDKIFPKQATSWAHLPAARHDSLKMQCVFRYHKYSAASQGGILSIEPIEM